MRSRFPCHVVLLVLLLFATAVQADIGAKARELMDNQRRILILREAASPEERAEARRAGQFLFFSNQHLVRNLIDEITHTAPEIPGRYKEFAVAIDDPVYADEDRLVLRPVLEGLLPRLPSDERHDARRRLESLSSLRRMLGADFAVLFQHMPLKSGRSASSTWGAYIARLTRLMTPAQILAELDSELLAAPESNVELPEAVARARALEWNGEELPERTLLLSFDDGPHPIHTPAILDILKEHGVCALFFQVGRNLGEIRNGMAMPEHNQPIETRLAAECHAVGNHSYSHPVLPKLNNQALVREIADTQALIEAMVPDAKARTGGFRPPYGARDEKVLAQIDLHHLRSVVWNIDSEDWADPLPESIAHRVVREAERQGRGIVLMHDIHARTVDALPLVIRELKKRGFQFLRWDGKRLVSDTAVANQ